MFNLDELMETINYYARTGSTRKDLRSFELVLIHHGYQLAGAHGSYYAKVNPSPLPSTGLVYENGWKETR